MLKWINCPMNNELGDIRKACLWCGEPVADTLGAGRKRKFCSKKCCGLSKYDAVRRAREALRPPRPCPICGNPIIGVLSKLFCSMPCYRTSRRDKTKEYERKRTAMRVQLKADYLASQPPVVCRCCGGAVNGRIDKIYCSKKCQRRKEPQSSNKSPAAKAAREQWQKSPEGKAAKKERAKEYRARPDVKERARARYASHHLTPEEKARRKAERDAAAKERRRIRKSAYKRAYRKTPAGKAEKRASRSRRRALLIGATVGDTRVIIAWDKLWKSKRFAICYWCSKKTPTKKCHADHKHPLSRGGQHSIENLCVSCSDCNLRKGARTVESWNETLESPVLICI